MRNKITKIINFTTQSPATIYNDIKYNNLIESKQEIINFIECRDLWQS